MAPSNLLLPFLCFLLTSAAGQASAINSHREKQHDDDRIITASKATKLFVFGDSYVDTGNIRKSLGNSWKEPYGTTFPGKPAGRFSDGRVLTDYFARFLGLKSPIAYEWKKLAGKKVQNGLNFAYGGSGVFDTLGFILPNMSSQIDFWEELIKDDKMYSTRDVQSSVVLVCLAGNDYGAYIARTGSIEGLQNFIPQVINQLSADLRRIHQLGSNKIVVTSLQPLGCLPRMTETTSYQLCNATQNSLVNYHNLLLNQAVAKLNNDTKTSSFFVLDLYNSFTTVLEQKGNYQGNLKFEAPLKPCCVGLEGYYCGGVDDNGNKMYSLCSDPTSYFFWDSSHPTEAGWRAVYMNLRSSLERLFKYD